MGKDLFGDSVFVKRSAFFEAQSVALIKQKEALTEDGWASVVIGPRETVHGEMSAMSHAEQEVDAKTASKLEKLAGQREQLESTEVEEGDEKAAAAIGAKLDALHKAEQAVMEKATLTYPEATKAVGTVFLALSADGSVQRH